jgi:hypothetical protein
MLKSIIVIFLIVLWIRNLLSWIRSESIYELRQITKHPDSYVSYFYCRYSSSQVRYRAGCIRQQSTGREVPTLWFVCGVGTVTISWFRYRGLLPQLFLGEEQEPEDCQPVVFHPQGSLGVSVQVTKTTKTRFFNLNPPHVLIQIVSLYLIRCIWTILYPDCFSNRILCLCRRIKYFFLLYVTVISRL